MLNALYYAEWEQCSEHGDEELYVDDMNVTSPLAVLMRSKIVFNESEWSIWMPIEELNAQSRYRHCKRPVEGDAVSDGCVPDLRYRSISRMQTSQGRNHLYVKSKIAYSNTLVRFTSNSFTVTKLALFIISGKLLGCFTGDYLVSSSNVISTMAVPPDVTGFVTCTKYCESKHTLYAAVSTMKQVKARYTQSEDLHLLTFVNLRYWTVGAFALSD